MILDNMNELDLIEYFQTFDVIDVDDKSLISKDIFYRHFKSSLVKRNLFLKR